MSKSLSKIATTLPEFSTVEATSRGCLLCSLLVVNHSRMSRCFGIPSTSCYYPLFHRPCMTSVLPIWRQCIEVKGQCPLRSDPVYRPSMAVDNQVPKLSDVDSSEATRKARAEWKTTESVLGPGSRIALHRAAELFLVHGRVPSIRTTHWLSSTMKRKCSSAAVPSVPLISYSE